MSSKKPQVPVIPAEAPNQYPTGRRCLGCPAILSRYNPYVVCGPCRVRAAGDLAGEIAIAEDLEDCGFEWERFPRREPVRRGPLLAESSMGPGRTPEDMIG